MTHNSDTDYSNLLSDINKVDAPPFLLTRIKEKAKATHHKKVGVGWVLAGSMSLILVLITNICVINSNSDTNKQVPNLAESMNLIPNNTLYQ